MTFLALQPLSLDLLPAAVALDQRCFGGLWTLDGYQRELESPNSELLVVVEKAEGRLPKASADRRQETGDRRQEAEGAREAEGAKEQKHLDSTLEISPSETLREQNSKLSPPRSTPHTLLPTPLVGLGCYWAILEEAHITMLAIDPVYQRQGLGQTLLYALIASAHARGLERATLEVRVSNASALALYQKFDFREAGRRRRYYPDNGEDALVLWRGGIQTPEFSGRLRDWQQQVYDRLCKAGWQLDIDSDR
ncbi:ribosomal protein S18-alanine N-acetyltransferase [Leptolyngbya sp. FACHB-321]|uniref:ribosomal protein S18-alanine N-acetyltransferase n=1 Tax=Leptolyngbya sp. FACHB-321 TaxID=2692807 RepID=UPI0016895A98|nr:ribosomal protein S18-alanine N-acetyltransferase [Leptolyngbya sp. FACHB-321]